MIKSPEFEALLDLSAEVGANPKSGARAGRQHVDQGNGHALDQGIWPLAARCPQGQYDGAGGAGFFAGRLGT